MKTSTKRQGISQYYIGGFFAVISIAGGCLSMAMNLTYGLQTSIFMAGVFVLSDCAKVLLPMVGAAITGWKTLRHATYVVAVIMSIMAATSYLLEKQADQLIQANASRDIAQNAKADIARLQTELETIGKAGDVSSLTLLHEEASAKASREAERGGCGRKCENAKAEAASLLSQLSKAKRRAEIERQLANARQTISETPAPAVGAADTIAWLTGIDRTKVASWEAFTKVIAMLVILELTAALSGAAGSMIVTTWHSRQTGTQKPKKVAMQTVVNSLQPDEKPKKSTRNYYLERLSKERPDLAAKVIAGELSCYKASIEAGFRKPIAKQCNLSKVKAHGKKLQNA